MKGDQLIPPGNFLSEDQTVFVKRSLYERIKDRLTTEPRLPVKGCEAAIATVLGFLNQLCKYTHIPSKRYQLENLVKPEYYKLIQTEEFENAFHDLYMEVMSFIGNDQWSYYYFKVKGTTLILEKGLDFRIVEWHKQQIIESEAYDHDLGGVQEGYELRDHPKFKRN